MFANPVIKKIMVGISITESEGKNKLKTSANGKANR
jgi:hypothetical protein